MVESRENGTCIYIYICLHKKEKSRVYIHVHISLIFYVSICYILFYRDIVRYRYYKIENALYINKKNNLILQILS